MMIFNVETHGDIRVCPICRRYIVTIANSPHPVARPRTRGGVTDAFTSAHQRINTYPSSLNSFIAKSIIDLGVRIDGITIILKPSSIKLDLTLLKILIS